MNRILKNLGIAALVVGRVAAFPFLTESSHEKARESWSYFPQPARPAIQFVYKPDRSAYFVAPAEPDPDIYFVCEDCGEEAD